MSLIQNEMVNMNVKEGDTTMAGFVARPPADHQRRPGLMVFQEAFGVNAHIRDVTARFAAQGYVAIAPELFHRTAPGFQGSYDDIDAAMTQLRTLMIEGIQADVRAAYNWLVNDQGTDPDRIACVGFCMGGRVSFIADATVPLRAAISYYGGGIAPGLINHSENLHGPILFYWGGLDKHIPATQHRAVIDVLTAVGKDFINVEFSKADHGFFCDERSTYNQKAAEQSWALSLEFLRANLK
ncbi:MAG TPA: dienelactone hydrolase family protein [Blastocatellia bacterium]